MPLFPIMPSINYNYISNFFKNYYCCQVTITITRIIPLQMFYVIISRTMVIFARIHVALVLAPALLQENIYEEWFSLLVPMRIICSGKSFRLWRRAAHIFTAGRTHELFTGEGSFMDWVRAKAQGIILRMHTVLPEGSAGLCTQNPHLRLRKCWPPRPPETPS